MTCPTNEDWTLLSMNLLDEERSEFLRRHVEQCAVCRERFQEARRDHVGLLHTYEAMDRDHDTSREKLMASLRDVDRACPPTGWLDRTRRRLGGINMKNSMTRRVAGLLSAAAIIAVIVSAYVGFGNGTAFADAIDHFRNTSTVVCRIVSGTSVSGFEVNSDGKLYFSPEYGSRSDISMFGQGLMTVYEPLDEPAIMIMPSMRTYMVIEKPDNESVGDLTQQPGEFIERLLRLSEDASKTLGREVLDGVEVVGFEIAPGEFGLATDKTSVRLYIDAADSLPVKFAIQLPGPETDSVVDVVMDRFEWDVPLDPELFEVKIPEGFTELNVTVPPASEETLLKGLEIYAELSGGRYPEQLDPMQLAADMGRLAVEQMTKNGEAIGPGSPGYEVFTQRMIVIGTAAEFYQKLIHDGRAPEYFGGEVTADDVDEVLVRWHLDNGGMRVVYGDLSIETVR